MQDVLLELIKSIENNVSDYDTKYNMYHEFIPHLRYGDIDLAESLREESEAYADAYETVLEEDGELEEE